MRTKFSWYAFAFFGTALFCLLTPFASAQESDWLMYSAKFICGERADDNAYVARGKYRTVINIHNPHYLPAGGISVYKKAVQARYQRADLGKISGWQREFLPPDAAIGVDCKDIRKLFQGVPGNWGFLEGFLVVGVPPWDQTVPIKIDVVGVYTHVDRAETAAPGSDAESIDVETFQPIRIYGVPPGLPAVQPQDGTGG
jgi:hypothetical protein